MLIEGVFNFILCGQQVLLILEAMIGRNDLRES